MSINNDDVCRKDGAFRASRRDHVPGYQANGDNAEISGYSGGLQRAWLEAELAAARREESIDWIVVCMHQVAMSSAHFNGADLGIRQKFMPLFDAYGVDLVVAGHEHHFERSFPVRGVLPGSSLLTPAPVHTARRRDPAEFDTRYGTLHLTIGGGGHPYRTPARRLHSGHEGIVIAGAGPGSPLVQHRSVIEAEPAVWSAYRETKAAVGFASVDVAPGEPDCTTSITITHLAA